MNEQNDMTATASIKFSASGNLEGIIRQVEDEIEAASQIPPDAKVAIKDYLKENFDEIFEKLSDLENYPAPEFISEWWPLIVEIIQKVIG